MRVGYIVVTFLALLRE